MEETKQIRYTTLDLVRQTGFWIKVATLWLYDHLHLINYSVLSLPFSLALFLGPSILVSNLLVINLVAPFAPKQLATSLTVVTFMLVAGAVYSLLFGMVEIPILRRRLSINNFFFVHCKNEWRMRRQGSGFILAMDLGMILVITGMASLNPVSATHSLNRALNPMEKAVTATTETAKPSTLDQTRFMKIGEQYDELQGRSVSTLETIKRINEFECYISNSTGKFDIDSCQNRIKGIIAQESHGNPKARNPRSGAAGLMGLMPANCEGINVYNSKQNISRACSILVYDMLIPKNNDWERALSLFNCSQGRNNNASSKAADILATEPDSVSWWVFREALPKETQEYIPKVFAWEWAFTYYDTCEFLPLVQDIITSKRQGIGILKLLADKQTVSTPATSPTISKATAKAPSASPTSSGNTYTVKRGDHLGKIGKKFGLIQDSLLALNPDIKANKNLIIPGQEIRIR